MSDAQQFLHDLDKKLWNAADWLRSSLDAAVSRTLAQLRDTLLPKLLSGELFVAEDRSLAEEALP